jgi:hypothetical protein
MIEPALTPFLGCVELEDEVPISWEMTVTRRQQSVQAVVERAIRLESRCRSLLPCGGPVAIGELLTALSTLEFESIAACLLEGSSVQHCQRMMQREVPAELFHDNIAFAASMRLLWPMLNIYRMLSPGTAGA